MSKEISETIARVSSGFWFSPIKAFCDYWLFWIRFFGRTNTDCGQWELFELKHDNDVQMSGWSLYKQQCGATVLRCRFNGGDIQCPVCGYDIKIGKRWGLCTGCGDSFTIDGRYIAKKVGRHFGLNSDYPRLSVYKGVKR